METVLSAIVETAILHREIEALGTDQTQPRQKRNSVVKTTTQVSRYIIILFYFKF